MANVTGTFAATGQSASFAAKLGARDINGGAFNIWLSGTAVATVQLEKSPDNGVTWFAVYAGGTKLYQWSYSNNGTGDNINETAQEVEQGVLYRLNCTAYTSGTLAYSLTGPQ